MMEDGIFLDEIKNTFSEFNYSWRSLFLNLEDISSKDNEMSSDLRNKDHEYVKVRKGSDEFSEYVEFQDSEKKRSEIDKTVGIVNWKGDVRNIELSLKGIPNKSRERRNDLFEVLNYAIKKKVDILVFPEVSIPFEWFPLLVEQASRHGMAIIGGLEYYIPHYLRNEVESGSQETQTSQSYPKAYNLLFAFFPISMTYYKSAFPLLRVKNYYSPGEMENIRGYHLSVPHPKIPIYHLIHWRNIYLSLYNCFELSDITDRALFKSKVDLITAVEFNSDVNYFSNVVESWARDLHCYILQANPSDFGDSRIVQPSKTETKDILKVKGGLYPLVLVGNLKIKELRGHQLKDHNLQMNDRRFKPTPARYDWRFAEARIKNISLEELPFSSESKENDKDNQEHGSRDKSLDINLWNSGIMK